MNNNDYFNTIRPLIADRITQLIFDAKLEGYRTIPQDRIQGLVDKATYIIADDIDRPDSSAFADYWEQVTRERFAQGIPISSVLKVIDIADDHMSSAIATQADFSDATKIELEQQVHRILRSGIMAMYRVYEESYNRLLLAQESAIRELSTPIVPIYEGVLVLPLVGSIDSARASTIMEELLESITKYQADVVIMDITGVPVIDTGIANYLLQAARAVRLLGSQIILVGISAEIAQTIVQLGIDLTGITTRANLQSGIEFALELLDLAIAHRSELRESA